MQLITNKEGYRCFTTFTGTLRNDFAIGAKKMNDEDILNKVMSYVRQHPNDEEIHEAAMDLLDELLV